MGKRSASPRMVSGGKLRSLDSKQVHMSDFTGRHPSVFDGGAFSEICHSIKATGGNLSPVLVTPRCTNGAQDGYLLLAGERRLRACQQLEINVLSIVLPSPMDDGFGQALSAIENFHSDDYSAFEFGQVCLQLLRRKCFKNQTALALALGCSESLVSQSIDVARLPTEVINAFPQVTEIQHRHGKVLKKALRDDRDGVLKRAREVSDVLPQDCTPKEVVAYLCGKKDEG